MASAEFDNVENPFLLIKVILSIHENLFSLFYTESPGSFTRSLKMCYLLFFFYFFNITYRALSICHDPYEYGKRRLALSELMVQLGCSEYGEVHGVQEKEWQTHISEVTKDTFCIQTSFRIK